MQLLIYYIAYPILWLISKLPFPIFYFVSDCFFVLLFYVVRYRRKTVTANIKMAMPYLSNEEVAIIERKSYQHLCDIFLEMIKTITISEKDLKERYKFTNLEDILAIEKQGKSVMLFCAHYANWEWMIILDKYINFKSHAVYKKINNPHFDNLFKRIRSRFDSQLIEMKETIRVIRKNEVEKNHGLYGFISDQSPMICDANYWQDFMGIEVPVFTGGEALCKKFGMEPMYLKVEYIKRGHYQATFVPLLEPNENVKEIPNYELTNRFIQQVEKQLHEAPAYYFWTHNRWKHRGKKPTNLKF